MPWESKLLWQFRGLRHRQWSVIRDWPLGSVQASKIGDEIASILDARHGSRHERKTCRGLQAPARQIAPWDEESDAAGNRLKLLIK